MSPDTVSLLFPDRPIRPLPKRRLRERLSPEVADSIKYPPSAHDNIPLFYYPPYTAKDETGAPSAESSSPIEQGRRSELARHSSLRRIGLSVAGAEEELRSTLVARSPPEILHRIARPSTRADQPPAPDPQPPPSTTSSVDGYDSFENTNNKKKRKIPTAGDSALNGTHALNSDLGSLAIPARAQSPVSELNGDGSQHGSTSTGFSGVGSYTTGNQGLSGSGRGRLSRSRNGRSPLRALSDGNSTWFGRTKSSPSQWSPTGQSGSSIISNAIANAEKLPTQGQENVSLLQQHSSTNKVMPASTQFTFTFESQVPGAVQWPGHPLRHNAATQTVSSLPAAVSVNVNMNQDGSPKAASGRSRYSRRKTRRRLERELLVAARHRRQVAAENYFHNPPKMEDIWICEFCEYERIFGEPPRTLIRDYEIKDRRHRQEEADRKRLLEKAKAKSRKGKKSGKASAKNNHMNHASDQLQSEPLADHDATPMDTGHSHSTQSDDEYEDDFDDSYSNPPPDRIHGIVNGHAELNPPSRAKT